MDPVKYSSNLKVIIQDEKSIVDNFTTLSIHSLANPGAVSKLMAVISKIFYWFVSEDLNNYL